MPTNESATGAPERHELRHVFNALFYVVKGGIPWRQMPNDPPPWKTVYYYFRKFQNLGIWQELNDALREKVRLKKGRKASPSAAILDSQSVKTTLVGGQRGYDAAKSVKGRKRHILVDTLGLLLAVVVHRADIDERRGAGFVLDRLSKVRTNFPRLKVIFADAGYSGEFETKVKKTYGWLLEIIRRPFGIKMFVLLPKRWIVERTAPAARVRLADQPAAAERRLRAVGQGLRSYDSAIHDPHNDSPIIKFRQSLREMLTLLWFSTETSWDR